MKPLTASDRRELKARAHALKPVVMIGNDGLTPAVVAEIDRALKSHELIKVRVAGDDREARAACLAEICARTGAQSVQHIGKILVIFRLKPAPEPAAVAPRRAARRPDRKTKTARDAPRRKHKREDTRDDTKDDPKHPLRKGLFDARKSEKFERDTPAGGRTPGRGPTRTPAWTDTPARAGRKAPTRPATEGTRAERAIARTEDAPRARPRGRPDASRSTRHPTTRNTARRNSR